MEEIKKEIDLLQEQIEQTTDPMIRCDLFLKKIDLLRVYKPKLNIKKMIKQLKEDIRDDE